MISQQRHSMSIRSSNVFERSGRIFFNERAHWRWSQRFMTWIARRRIILLWKKTMNHSKLGWYLLCLSIGAVFGVVVLNQVGWLFSYKIRKLPLRNECSCRGSFHFSFLFCYAKQINICICLCVLSAFNMGVCLLQIIEVRSIIRFKQNQLYSWCVSCILAPKLT